MALSLDLTEDQHSGGYLIGWFDPADDIDGDMCLGEVGDEDHNYISKRVRELVPPDWVDSGGRMHWESYSTAKKALVLARRVWKEYKQKVPWPDWALRAVAAGFKPPKGWTPCQE